MRNIQPASYLGGGDEEFQEWIKPLRENKKFIYTGNADELFAIEKCPKCGRVFDEQDYDSYI